METKRYGDVETGSKSEDEPEEERNFKEVDPTVH
jgi:hypothetical protein